MNMRTEWTWRHNRYVSERDATASRAVAESMVARVRSLNPGDDVAVVTRQVTEWAEVSNDSQPTDEPWPQCMYGELAQCWCKDCQGLTVPGRTGLDEECEP